ncbi:MAG: response regulator [Chloroflexota bacterium]
MRKKILVIEDNEQNLYLMTFLLGAHGFDVLEAKDGQIGIEVADQERPDLILLDIQLPILDGYHVAKTLRQNPKLNETPIIAVTSYAMVGDKEEALASGCNGYIEKPINPDTFMDEIKLFLV